MANQLALCMVFLDIYHVFKCKKLELLLNLKVILPGRHGQEVHENNHKKQSKTKSWMQFK